ncbi:MAG: DUF3127 domain-containing protein [Bacteroidales bacterium]|nr:DUF3127 domain-containing protein [Bacteroidales bacterium]
MELIGKITEILPEIKGQGKNGEWKRQEFILEIPGEYPRKICMTIWGDRVNLNDFKVNENVTASFDLESREFNGKWYTTVKVWRIVKEDASKPESKLNTISSDEDSFSSISLNDEPEGDLPF